MIGTVTLFVRTQHDVKMVQEDALNGIGEESLSDSFPIWRGSWFL
jgi:hypothetical protein